MSIMCGKRAGMPERGKLRMGRRDQCTDPVVNHFQGTLLYFLRYRLLPEVADETS
jgi:hypothetical protein